MRKGNTRSKRDGLFLRGKVWYFRRTTILDGVKTRVAVSTECEDRRQAERRRTELDKDMNDGKFGWKDEPAALVPTLETYLLGPVLEYAKTKGDRTASYWQTVLTRLVQAFPDRRLDELMRSECETYLGGRRTELASNTVRSEHIVFKSAWNRARADKLVVENPWQFKMVKMVARERILTVEEEQQLLPALPITVQRAVTVALYTGLRNHELCWIEQRDLDFKRMRITVRAEIAKGGKRRVVPMIPLVAEVLKAQIRDLNAGRLDRVFWRRKADCPRLFPYAVTSLTVSLWKVVQVFGWPALTIHDMRRTFGTRCAESGVPMKVLQRWLGHSNINMTASFYTAVDELRPEYLARITGPTIDAEAPGVDGCCPTCGQPAKMATAVATAPEHAQIH